ncbi:unnamed protein product [Acanthoscelides obtectus]|uniref:Uncharacterized protein n=1 Tax=Acanthoscelides obtectus TaxID=200917 RepID=A0A9P0KDU3_ACAOB|nr:unnamed protein product [Acanthoscelides obtectus]CAK1626339.1 hypothetical protein AOBTE_LOCUS3788 [Acanthoscelides obtectus]
MSNSFNSFTCSYRLQKPVFLSGWIKKADLRFMTLKETTRRSRSSCQLLTAGEARDIHSRKLNIQKWKKLCTCDNSAKWKTESPL